MPKRFGRCPFSRSADIVLFACDIELLERVLVDLVPLEKPTLRNELGKQIDRSADEYEENNGGKDQYHLDAPTPLGASWH